MHVVALLVLHVRYKLLYVCSLFNGVTLEGVRRRGWGGE